jgi:hypothetical protein
VPAFAGRHARPQTLDRAVPDHSHVAFRESKLLADLAPRFLRIESQTADHALAIGKLGEACLSLRHSRRFRSFATVRLTPRTNEHDSAELVELCSVKKLIDAKGQTAISKSALLHIDLHFCASSPNQ